jgi:hypothetical protein
MAIPVVAYFWFLHHYALNVIYWDQWSDIYTVNHDWFGNLWAQHDVHRILFPNLVVVFLAEYTHLNVILEEFISAGCLVAATALLVIAHRRRAPATTWLFYVPVVAVMLSLNQVQNTLWGFQLAWYMVLLTLAASIYVIDSPALSWAHVGVAIFIAVVGSFSSLMGLFIWPVGLLILLQRRRRPAFGWVWTASALITAAIYFHGFAFSQSESGNDNSYALQHPLVTLKYLIFGLGGSVGLPASPAWLPMLFGAVLLVVSCGALAVYGLRRDETSGRTIGIALIVFGLLFAASTALGRTWAGLFFASRYNTFNFLLLVGSYLALFDRPGASLRGSTVASSEGEITSASTSRLRSAHGAPRKWRKTWPAGVLVIVAVLLCVEVVSGTQQGIKEAGPWRAAQLRVAAVTLNIDRVPNSVIDTTKLYPGTAPSFLRTLAAEAAAMRLSLFGTAPPSDVLSQEQGSARLVKPTPNSLLRGQVLLVAATSGPLGISRVTFRLSGGPLRHGETVGRGAVVDYVWISSWDSRTVPDGTYKLQVLADSSLGRSFVSSVVSVRVAN